MSYSRLPFLFWLQKLFWKNWLTCYFLIWGRVLSPPWLRLCLWPVWLPVQADQSGEHLLRPLWHQIHIQELKWIVLMQSDPEIFTRVGNPDPKKRIRFRIWPPEKTGPSSGSDHCEKSGSSSVSDRQEKPDPFPYLTVKKNRTQVRIWPSRKIGYGSDPWK